MIKPKGRNPHLNPLEVDNMKVLSLFDGMSCGMLAMNRIGVPIDRYVAYEIDKYALQVSAHNFPMIEQRGDVFQADFTEFDGFDLVIGGSPCTYWSIAQQSGKRETEARGIGWNLFQQYVRAIKEAKPNFFVYENNKSMAPAIKEEICQAFGFEPILINSALVSAQKRERFYWVGIRNDDGTYRKADIEQPEDKGILLKDIIENGEPLVKNDKSFCLTSRCNGAIPSDTITKRRHTMVANPVRIGCYPTMDGRLTNSQGFRIYDSDGKSVTISACGGGKFGGNGLYAVPVSERSEEVYEVKDGQITIKGTQYPIKLTDGLYTIRKLSVDECKRLQTVPDSYDMSVISNTQAYKCLGNGWTVDVIAHLFTNLLNRGCKSLGCEVDNMLIFYDFEVFKEDWLVVFIDPANRSETVIINDPDKLKTFYEDNKNKIWVGYNSRNYDQWITKAILCDFNPKDVNDWIIVKDRKGWQFSDLFRNFPINNYDTMSSFYGLKQLEAFMGNDIRETSVPFNIDRKLTAGELAETVKYCRHDVEQTIEVFLRRKAEFDAHMGLIKAFGLPLSYISKTTAQLVASILGASKREYSDEFAVSIPDTLKLSNPKYLKVVDFFTNAVVDTVHEMEANGLDYNDPEQFKKAFYDRRLEINVAGVPHIFAWGGVHGAISQYVDNKGGCYIMSDVASLYPSLMIRYNYFSRSINDPKKYVEIYETNLKMKKTKDPLRPAYKLVCNTTYGCLKDPYNPLCDPLMANNICVAGQLLLLDLIEKLEPYCEMIQSNTDGILIKIDDTDEAFDRVDRIVHEWEVRTGLNMEFSDYRKVFQGDVNNYVIIDLDGHYKSKGAYVKELDELDNDLPIVNKAIMEYLVNGIHPRDIINGCDDMMQYQKVVKVSSKYAYGTLNGQSLNDKTFRVFASNRPTDGIIGKVKKEGATVEKFANTPDKCFIWNESVKGVKCPKYLDKGWYIDLAIKRIGDKFGMLVR